MEHFFTPTLLIIRCTVDVIGIFPSAFIASFHMFTWANGGNLKTCDYILLTVGISGVVFQSVRMAESLLLMEEYFNASVIVQLHLWTGSSNFWLKACLCAYYCVKIVELNNLLLFWLKRRISKLVPPMLLLSVVGSLLLSIPSYWSVYREFLQNPSTNLTANCSLRYYKEILKVSHSYNVVSSSLGFYLPALLDMLSITLIIMSLCRHTRRMKENTLEFCQPRIDVHVGAIKMVVSLLLANILYVLSEAVSLHSTDSLLKAIFEVTLASTMPALYIIMIVGNTKMRQALWKMISVWRK